MKSLELESIQRSPNGYLWCLFFFAPYKADVKQQLFPQSKNITLKHFNFYSNKSVKWSYLLEY